MSEKPWLDNYPPEIPAEIDPTQYISLKALLESSFQRFGDLAAFSNLGVSLSFREVETLSRYFATYLQSVAGLSTGDRVAVMMPNLLQYPVALFGILRAGFVAVNVNPLYTPRELEHQLRDSGARAIIVLENFASTLQKVRDRTDVQTVIVSSLGDHYPPIKRALTNLVVRRVKKLVPKWDIQDAVGYRQVLSKGCQYVYEDVPVKSDQTAFLQYTGGTTGVAKGAILTHRNMVSNVLQLTSWTGPFITGKNEVVITALPLYHIFSLTVNLFGFVELGGCNVLITNPRDLPAFVKELKGKPFSFISGVNTLFNGLLNTPGFSSVDFSTLKGSLGGGMAVQRSVAEKWQEVTGNVLTQGYGLTETSPIVTSNLLDGSSFNGSVGLPVPSTEVAIFDDDGQVLATGEIGEICVRGPQVMRGYWNQPEETSAVFLDGGWFCTGDIGRMDEQGFVYIEDRKNDLIIVSGFNVYPNEIEDVVAAHPGVLEVAAVGVEDEHSGERVKLFVVKKDKNLTESSLIEHCREGLTAYKVPRQVVFRDELPKTSVGKVLRRALKDQ
ncbi:MAG: AMP-binding protein [Gammaproteobacteria bacterium]